jgi:hypothetical protein
MALADVGASGNFNDALRVLYPIKKILAMAYNDCPLLGMIPKRTDFSGKQLDVPVWYGNPQGISATYASAATGKSSGKVDAFNLTRVNKYGLTSVQGETLDASTQQGAIGSLTAMKMTIDGTLHSLTNSLCQDLYGAGGGALGTVGSLSTVSLTLGNVEDVVNFETDMYVSASAGDGTATTHTLRDSSATVAVTAVNRNTGVLTAGANWTAGISGITTGDYLFRAGDFQSVISGLRAWVPDSDPGSTAFFGVNRSTDVVRLGGVRYTGTSDGSIEEALQKGLTRLAREGAMRRGGKISVFMNTADRHALSRSLGSKAIYEKTAPNGLAGRIGYATLTLHDFNVPVEVYADPFAPVGRALALLLPSWSLATLGPAPKILAKDGLRILRETDDDAYEFRCGYRGNLLTHAPGYNLNMTLPTS